MLSALAEDLAVPTTGPIPLTTADVAALEPQDLTRWVGNIVVQAIMGAPAGVHLDRARLAELVQAQVGELLVGDRLRFQPIYDTLLKVKGVTEHSLYLALVNLKGRLEALNLELEEPRIQLSDPERLEILDEAHAAAENARARWEESRLRHAVASVQKKRLGELLVEKGVLSRDQLNEALGAQQHLGGKLGTNLVELGFLTEEQLANFLGQQLGIPCITTMNPSQEALALVPIALALQHRLIPISVDRHNLTVAMADPLDLEAVDALRFATAKRIHPVVAPELAIDYAQARHYGVRKSTRVFRGEDNEETFGLSARPVLVPGYSEIAKTYGREQLLRDLCAAESEIQVYGAVQELMEAHFTTSAIFRVEGEQVRGWSQSGRKLAPWEFRRLSIPTSDPLVRQIIGQKKAYKGPGAPQIGGDGLTGPLGLSRETFLWVLPVLEQNNVVALLVATAPRDWNQTIFDERTAEAAGVALEMVAQKNQLRRLLETESH